MNASPMIAQIVLAAGLSTRMGSPKPLLDFGGRPLLSVLLQECLHSRADRTLLVVGHARDAILERIDLSGITVVVNTEYRKGQTGSFQCAIRALDPAVEAFANFPADHPFVTRREINALIEAFRNRSGEELIFVPVCQGEEGRPVLFDGSLRKEILALEPDEPARSVIERFRNHARYVAIDNPYTMKDMDTPEEYDACLAIFRSLRKAEGN